MDEGVVESLETGTDVTSQSKIIADIPNAVLITDSHDDQIEDIPKLFNKVVDGSDKFGVYCTKECCDQIISKFPQLAGRRSAFNIVEPNRPTNYNRLVYGNTCILYCLSLYVPLLCFNFRAIAAIIRTTMTNTMNGATQLSVVGDEILVGGLEAVALVLVSGGCGVVELESEG
ncbi:MAG: hypothetical protein WA667_06955 [Candidatus Nitrosopolaris sp.]